MLSLRIEGDNTHNNQYINNNFNLFSLSFSLISHFQFVLGNIEKLRDIQKFVRREYHQHIDVKQF